MADPTRAGAPHRPFTLLLRLLPQHGTDGRLVGHAEVVATSEVVAIGTEHDLIELVRRLSTDEQTHESVREGFHYGDRGNTLEP